MNTHSNNLSNVQSFNKIPWLTSKNPVRIAIIGDIILDEYLIGNVQRISPEAPVPVHHVQNVFHSAGGAANVALNISHLGGEVMLFGVLGQDATAEHLKDLLKKNNISSQFLITSDDRPSIKKTRVLANNQQIVRVDWEQTQPIPDELQKKLLQSLEGQKPDVIVISDYGKGLLQKKLVEGIIAFAKKNNIPSVVDPKGKDFARYNGAFVITPNKKEALEAVNIDALAHESAQKIAERLFSQFKPENFLVTLGAEGMQLANKNEKTGELSHKFFPAKPRQVFDVSGAGDTVVAVISLCLAANLSLEEAVPLANLAAGRVVEKIGTQPIFLHEFEEELAQTHLQSSFSDSRKKVLETQVLAKILGARGIRSKKIVFTNGCFDLLHVGHLDYLEKARALGDCLVVAINTDESIRELKGAKRPIQNLESRARLLAGLACVDYVTFFSESTPLATIKAISPDILVKGADYKVSDIVGGDIVINYGGKVQTLPLVEGQSTSSLIAKIVSAQ